MLLFAGLGAGYTYFKENKANIMNLAASAASTVTFGKDIYLGNNCIKWTDGAVCSKGDVGGGGGGAPSCKRITASCSGAGCTATLNCPSGKIISLCHYGLNSQNSYCNANSCGGGNLSDCYNSCQTGVQSTQVSETTSGCYPSSRYGVSAWALCCNP